MSLLIGEYVYDWVLDKSKISGFLNAKKQPLRSHEMISVFYKKQPIYNPQITQGKPYDKGIRTPQTDDDVTYIPNTVKE